MYRNNAISHHHSSPRALAVVSREVRGFLCRALEFPESGCLKLCISKYIVGALLLLWPCFSGCGTQPIANFTVASPVTAFAWPIYIAKEGGYYEKYGLRVNIVAANHPADMAMLMSGEAGATLTTLEQAMQMSPKTRGELIIIGSPLKKWLFALVARHNISNVRELKGKRIGITQLGGSTYYYAVHLLAEFGLGIRDVEWVSVGNSRVPALTSGRIDATMISAPAYFSLEDAGYKSVANILEFDNIHIPNVILLKKSTVAQNPELPALLLKAHAEAVKRFYADKAFALTAYLQYDKQGFVGLARVYDIYAQANALDRVPYIMTDAVQYMIDSAPDTRMKAEMTSFDYRSVIDNSIVDKLIQEGFFLKLFGKDGKVEQEGKIAHAFR